MMFVIVKYVLGLTLFCILLDETDEEDVQARKRRMAERAAAGVIEDVEVRTFLSKHIFV